MRSEEDSRLGDGDLGGGGSAGAPRLPGGPGTPGPGQQGPPGGQSGDGIGNGPAGGQGSGPGGGANGGSGSGPGAGARKPGRRGKPRQQRSFWKELPFLVIVALGLALLIKTFLVQAFYIPSGSMEDTLEINDRVLVNKLSYRFGPVERGDVIVFDGTDSWQSEIDVAPPGNAFEGFMRKVGEVFGFAPVGEKDFIKRVIGIPGDTVQCGKDGIVRVNGKKLDESAYVFPKGDKASAMPFKITVPPGRVWVMGDHRSESADSRFHTGDPGGGTIPIDHIVGRAFVIVWPVSRWSMLDRPEAYAKAGLALGPAQVSRTGPLDADGVSTLALGVPLGGLTVLRRRRRRRQSAARAEAHSAAEPRSP